jgi:hypothetical protein
MACTQSGTYTCTYVHGKGSHVHSSSFSIAVGDGSGNQCKYTLPVAGDPKRTQIEFEAVAASTVSATIIYDNFTYAVTLVFDKASHPHSLLSGSQTSRTTGRGPSPPTEDMGTYTGTKGW